eukprot:5895922-Alexandrium_andersonii.AAC.1
MVFEAVPGLRAQFALTLWVEGPVAAGGCSAAGNAGGGNAGGAAAGAGRARGPWAAFALGVILTLTAAAGFFRVGEAF